mmetsp:Transcript_10257/g.32660  ORF Transcript_10257/g.32660 Transcript_10257/m.32660 type:complete len:434 (-) Transcript_10257:27-1328(-)
MGSSPSTNACSRWPMAMDRSMRMASSEGHTEAGGGPTHPTLETANGTGGWETAKSSSTRRHVPPSCRYKSAATWEWNLCMSRSLAARHTVTTIKSRTQRALFSAAKRDSSPLRSFCRPSATVPCVRKYASIVRAHSRRSSYSPQRRNTLAYRSASDSSSSALILFIFAAGVGAGPAGACCSSLSVSCFFGDASAGSSAGFDFPDRPVLLGAAVDAAAAAGPLPGLGWPGLFAAGCFASLPPVFAGPAASTPSAATTSPFGSFAPSSFSPPELSAPLRGLAPRSGAAAAASVAAAAAASSSGPLACLTSAGLPAAACASSFCSSASITAHLARISANRARKRSDLTFGVTAHSARTARRAGSARTYCSNSISSMTNRARRAVSSWSCRVEVSHVRHAASSPRRIGTRRVNSACERPRRAMNSSTARRAHRFISK